MVNHPRDVFGKILGALFVLSSLPKLLSVHGAVANFNTWHLGDTWRYVVGALELACGVSMFIPSAKRLGAFGFLFLMPAAFVTHVAAGQYFMTPMPLVAGIIVLIYLVRQGAVHFRA